MRATGPFRGGLPRGLLMGAAGLIILAIWVVILMAQPDRLPLRATPAHPVSGAVAAIHTNGSGLSVLLRDAPKGVTQVKIDRSHPAVTSDGYALTTADIRPGDQMLATANQIIDRSQHWTTVRGILAQADPTGTGIMVLQVAPARSIVMDVDARTRVVGGTQKGITLATLQEADQVRISGSLDRNNGEMTRIASITWLAP